MNIDRTHKPWAIYTAVISALLTMTYLIYRYTSSRMGGTGPSGGTIPGLIYGALGLFIMIFCAMLGARRRFRVVRLGRASVWMKAHIWVGLIAIPLVFFHSGMRFGHNLTWLLMILFCLVMISGIIGVALQHYIPSVMLRGVDVETTYEQIPQVIESLKQEADDLVSKVCGPLDDSAEPVVNEGAERARVGVLPVSKDCALHGIAPRKPKMATQIEGSEPLRNFYLKEIQPFLRSRSPLPGRLSNAHSSAVFFEYTRTLLPVSLHEHVQDLQDICEERRQLFLQEQLHLILHGWLFVHVPLSYMLLALSLLHAVVAPLKF